MRVQPAVQGSSPHEGTTRSVGIFLSRGYNLQFRDLPVTRAQPRLQGCFSHEGTIRSAGISHSRGYNPQCRNLPVTRVQPTMQESSCHEGATHNAVISQAWGCNPQCRYLLITRAQSTMQGSHSCEGTVRSGSEIRPRCLRETDGIDTGPSCLTENSCKRDCEYELLCICTHCHYFLPVKCMAIPFMYVTMLPFGKCRKVEPTRVDDKTNWRQLRQRAGL